MGRNRHKRKNSHVVIVTSDAADSGMKQFRIRPWILKAIIAVLCVVIGALIGYLVYEKDIWAAELEQTVQQVKPFFHGGQRIDRPDSGFHRRLCPQRLVYAPAILDRPSFFLQTVRRVPPIHLEIPRQYCQQRFFQIVDVGNDSKPVNFRQPVRQRLGGRRRQRLGRCVLLERGRKGKQHGFFCDALIHPRSLRL